MSHNEIIRAWKDEEYRNSLSKEQYSHLPENPAGQTMLTDEDMEAIVGGINPHTIGRDCTYSAICESYIL
jgi:mersacidin/lichenicidin family type 2 lantibiotic